MKHEIHWPRLLIEGVVIVAGILIAFGLEAWWGGRAERIAEVDYLERVRDDLSATRQNVVEQAAHYRNLSDHGEAVLEVMSGARSIPNDTLGFLASALQPSRMTEPVVSRGAYDDMISTGNLRVIRDADLRNALSEFYGGIDFQISPIDYQPDKNPYRETVRGIIPPRVQLEIRFSCLGASPLTCPGGPEIAGLSGVAATLAAEPGLDRKLRVLLQALLIRPGSVLNIDGRLAAGFELVVENIDRMLLQVEAALES